MSDNEIATPTTAYDRRSIYRFSLDIYIRIRSIRGGVGVIRLSNPGDSGMDISRNKLVRLASFEAPAAARLIVTV